MQFFQYVLVSLVTALLLNFWALSTGSMTPFLTAGETVTLAKVVVTNSKAPTASDRAYYFTMTLPEGNRFAKLSLSEQNVGKGASLLQFHLPTAQAFLGTPTTRGRAVQITDTWVDETGTMWLEFAPALPPKTTLTVVFQPQVSSSRGTHEYGIAAYPDTQYPIPVFVGNGTVIIQ
ncbi:MAG: DUF2808 domain-containing protein [Oscillatoriales cyanobacterium C42_A2020_001]|nr:DUF2808 domain-containing protein [Leptolyngbyaceae cyanobacterium C42_A2020_001]